MNAQRVSATTNRTSNGVTGNLLFPPRTECPVTRVTRHLRASRIQSVKLGRRFFLAHQGLASRTIMGPQSGHLVCCWYKLHSS
jgi:hypothetical protein